MKKLKVFLTVMFVVMMASSFAYAGSFSYTTTNFKRGDKYYNSSYLYNCVSYARWLQPALPYSLFTLADKKAIINSSKPKKKSVAIINVGNSIGHVAYVADVDDSGSSRSITLYEANYPSGVERKRVLKGKDKSVKEIGKYFGIVGYWKP